MPGTFFTPDQEAQYGTGGTTDESLRRCESPVLRINHYLHSGYESSLNTFI